MKLKLIALLISCIDLSKLAKGLILLGEEAATEAAAKTATPIDDAVEAVAFPALNPAVFAAIDAELAKIKAELGV